MNQALKTLKAYTVSVLAVAAIALSWPAQSPFAWAAPAKQDSNWKIDPVHSVASFSVRHLGISNVRGEFTKVTGEGYYDGKTLSTAWVKTSIDISSISTRETKRDDHLKSPDFFDAATYPTMTFASKRLRPMSRGKFQMVGDLTLHGVTRTVVLSCLGPTDAVKDPMGTMRFGASAQTTVNRKDYGLRWDKRLDNGGAIVGDEVSISLDVEFVRPK